MESLISHVDSIILGFVQGSFVSLTATIQTLWRLMFVVFIAVYGYKVIISGRFSASDLIWHCLKIVILLVIATQWDTFFLFAVDRSIGRCHVAAPDSPDAKNRPERRSICWRVCS